jgi:hypothetical protein
MIPTVLALFFDAAQILIEGKSGQRPANDPAVGTALGGLR